MSLPLLPGTQLPGTQLPGTQLGARRDVPLAERMRPVNAGELVGPARAAHARLQVAGTPVPAVVWGPPGSGKTTLARVLAAESGRAFEQLSAVLDGVKELRAVLEKAAATTDAGRPAPILFVDEIHRWNKAQQDGLLPYLERGVVILLGATTENPSFALNAALRSRVRVVRLEPPDDDDVAEVLVRAQADPARGIGREAVDGDALTALARSAGGDVRRALVDLERAAAESARVGRPLRRDELGELLSRSDVRHDATGTDHYDVVSALIKSMRGSDPDAAIYWLARMLSGGEDPMFVARRLMIFAAEDVGLADPAALGVATSATLAVERIGMPEGRIPLAEAVVYLATAPKSNTAYLAINAAMEVVAERGALPVPLHLRQGGAGYRYPHDAPGRILRQQHLPDPLVGTRFYDPAGQANETKIAERLAWWQRKLDESE